MSRIGQLNLDEIAAAAIEAAIYDRVEAAQISKLMELLESLKDIGLLTIFLARQVAREFWGKRGRAYSARRLANLLQDKSISEARVLLGTFRWLYEIVRAFRPRMDDVFRPGSPAPQNLFNTLMGRCLR